jgi:hypothetical protein
MPLSARAARDATQTVIAQQDALATNIAATQFAIDPPTAAPTNTETPSVTPTETPTNTPTFTPTAMPTRTPTQVALTIAPRQETTTSAPAAVAMDTTDVNAHWRALAEMYRDR